MAQGTQQDQAPACFSDFSPFSALIFWEDIKLISTSEASGIFFFALDDISPYFQVSGFVPSTQNFLCENRGSWVQTHWKDAGVKGQEVTGTWI